MSRLLLGFLLLTPALVSRAEYTSSCTTDAMSLSSAASSLDSKLRSFKSGCDSYIGYSKDDESACGEFGYLRTPLKSAARQVDSANNQVSNSCGTCDDATRATIQAASKMLGDLKKENASLKEKIQQLESENASLRKATP